MSSTPLVIRQATIDDAQAIALVYVTPWRIPCNHILPQAFLGTPRQPDAGGIASSVAHTRDADHSINRRGSTPCPFSCGLITIGGSCTAGCTARPASVIG